MAAKGGARTTRKTPDGGSAARERLLRTAVDLFYAEGIHAVGVDRIVEAAGITRATFYRHFPGKEDLVLAYLDAEDVAIRAAFAAAAGSGATPRELLGLVIHELGEDVARRHTRGCPFINAAAEYPDPGSGVRERVREHREWFRATLEQLAAAAGVPDPVTAAGQLVLLRDAAMVGGYLDGWERVRDAFTAAAMTAAGLDDGTGPVTGPVGRTGSVSGPDDEPPSAAAPVGGAVPAATRADVTAAAGSTATVPS
ncbi:TetR family transcriptional regulator [Nakamurella sp. YIM 132087]|uniref:TetR family transcriptional regulator n=1 Tax=Nakamurella alba TaxID=2665158 RepID=A0A7K1FTJ9_9ACTN|nr:TetR/AcrR family transcriptional regulator [Nakamurella alba]MTD17448.1 TetR family transcriptional regulator [Nakamurella alba]